MICFISFFIIFFYLFHLNELQFIFYYRLKIQVTISLTAFLPTGVTHEEENKTSRSYLNTLNQTLPLSRRMQKKTIINAVPVLVKVEPSTCQCTGSSNKQWSSSMNDKLTMKSFLNCLCYRHIIDSRRLYLMRALIYEITHTWARNGRKATHKHTPFKGTCCQN